MPKIVKAYVTREDGVPWVTIRWSDDSSTSGKYSEPRMRQLLDLAWRYDKFEMEWKATHLRGNTYAVRPKDQLGTCGFFPVPWQVLYIDAKNEVEALRKAKLEE